MKTKFFTLLAVALLLSSFSFAKIFRVADSGRNYPGGFCCRI